MTRWPGSRTTKRTPALCVHVHRGTMTLLPEDFRFRIDDVFDIAGRGRAVVGVIEAGQVRAGDELRLISADAVSEPFEVRDVSGVRDARWQPGEPARVGLIVPE